MFKELLFSYNLVEKKKSFQLMGFNGNGMLCHALGGAVILFSLQHFIAPALDLLPCLQAQDRWDSSSISLTVVESHCIGRIWV